MVLSNDILNLLEYFNLKQNQRINNISNFKNNVFYILGNVFKYLLYFVNFKR